MDEPYEPGDKFNKVFSRLGITTDSDEYRVWMQVAAALLESVGLPPPDSGFTKRDIRQAIMSGHITEDHAIAVLTLSITSLRPVQVAY